MNIHGQSPRTRQNILSIMYNVRMHTRTIAVAVLSFILGTISVGFAYAWNGPTAAPPNGNVAAPINVGPTDQVKNGGLGLNSLAVFGNSLFGGSAGSNAYLNFGDTSGSSGYGIRDNAGTLEFKNDGGDWASIQSSIQSLTGITSAVSTTTFANGINVQGGCVAVNGTCLGTGGGGMSGWEVIYNTCSGATCSAACSAGKKATGGGCVLINGGGNLQDSYGGESGWTCDYNGSINTVRAQVYCLSI